MSESTAIEWTDATWNPLVGCAKVSQGCANCYAQGEALRVVRRLRGTMAKRADGGTPRMRRTVEAYESVLKRDANGELLPRWNGKVALLPERLAEPLRWKRGRRVFVDSMSDLFHPSVPFEFVAVVFGVMAAARQHTFQVLTKRPERMHEFFEWLRSQDQSDFVRLGQPQSHLAGLYSAIDNYQNPYLCGVTNGLPPSVDADESWWEHEFATADRWPLLNVELVVSAEDQATLDARVPWLLKCPAAVRGVSLEPLLGPANLREWARPLTFLRGDESSWSEVTWPDWVPASVREAVEKFWSVFGRTPADWARSCRNSVPFGVEVVDAPGWGDSKVSGRWIHCWSNIGRVVDSDGVAHFASVPLADLFDSTGSHQQTLRSFRPLDWVTVGGEDGPGARPIHPEWVRDVRDVCAAAGVAFHFKQWGAWLPYSQGDSEFFDGLYRSNKVAGPWECQDTLDECYGRTCTVACAWVSDEGQFALLEDSQGFRGLRGDLMSAFRVGKKRAGRTLDGRTWDELPARRT